ncbi:MAG: chemotaxis response regulator protein-glutamate methylesterase [Gammaproteobacteria bacterium]|nr:chemotaxis response regulator protein-glutamate methylesterase [Gammaproteobacteria bacterium]
MSINIMIVDDSAVVRQTLTQIFQSDAALSVLGAYSNPLFAIRAMEERWPDVLILDVEMPGMDGITFLRSLMRTQPLPVIICSSLTTKGASTTLEAMAAGAVEVIAKPVSGLKDHLETIARDMIQSVKTAASAKVSAISVKSPGTSLMNNAQQLMLQQTDKSMTCTTDHVLAIGTSTGGTQALEYLLCSLPVTVPAIVIVQHMPEAFTRAFAERLDKVSSIRVKEAEHNERILPGHAYIARGGVHLQIRRQGAFYYTVVKDGPAVSRHKPSVNVLFSSVAQQAGANASGYLLTGMGDDGARGLLEMKNAGAKTYAQDEASCVVFGMPKEAIKLNAVDHIQSLQQIGQTISALKVP